jgi:hypothetical protein
MMIQYIDMTENKEEFEIPKFECKRCKHVWYPRRPIKPPRCPSCGSPYWNKERIKHDKNG